MQGGVQLAVAAAIEPVPLLVAGGGWNGCGPVVHGERGAGAKATHIGGFAKEFGSGQDAAARECQQTRRKRRHHARQLLLELIDARVQLRGPGCQLPSQLGNDTVAAIEQRFDSLNRRPPAQRPRRNLESRLQLMKQPLQPILYSGSLADQVLTVVEQQLDFPAVVVQMCLRQVGFTQRGASHGERINGVRLAVLAQRTATCSGGSPPPPIAAYTIAVPSATPPGDRQTPLAPYAHQVFVPCRRPPPANDSACARPRPVSP